MFKRFYKQFHLHRKPSLLEQIESGEHWPTYSELLQDERWKAKRREILELGGYKCKQCGSANNLQVHHKYYNRFPDNRYVEPWDYPNDALICLCDECHKKWHEQHTVKFYYRKFEEHY